jgi:hypothetical protein
MNLRVSLRGGEFPSILWPQREVTLVTNTTSIAVRGRYGGDRTVGLRSVGTA